MEDVHGMIFFCTAVNEGKHLEGINLLAVIHSVLLCTVACSKSACELQRLFTVLNCLKLSFYYCRMISSSVMTKCDYFTKNSDHMFYVFAVYNLLGKIRHGTHLQTTPPIFSFRCISIIAVAVIVLSVWFPGFIWLTDLF